MEVHRCICHQAGVSLPWYLPVHSGCRFHCNVVTHHNLIAQVSWIWLMVLWSFTWVIDGTFMLLLSFLNPALSSLLAALKLKNKQIYLKNSTYFWIWKAKTFHTYLQTSTLISLILPASLVSWTAVLIWYNRI